MLPRFHTLILIFCILQVKGATKKSDELGCEDGGGGRAGGGRGELVVDVEEVTPGDYVRVTLRYLDCRGIRRSGVTHTDPGGLLRVNLQWRPPNHYIGPITLHATLVSRGEAWTFSSPTIMVTSPSMSARVGTSHGALEANISSLPIAVLGFGEQEEQAEEGREKVEKRELLNEDKVKNVGEGRANSRAMVDAGTEGGEGVSSGKGPEDGIQSSEGPWRSVLIGGDRGEEGLGGEEEGGMKPRFLEGGDGWDRWDAWSPPQPEEEVTWRPVVVAKGDGWDRWDAWRDPIPGESSADPSIEAATRGPQEAFYGGQGTPRPPVRQHWPLIDRGMEVGKTSGGDRRVQEVTRRGRDPIQRSTGEVEEVSTTWRSVMMMPRREKATTTRRPVRRRIPEGWGEETRLPARGQEAEEEENERAWIDEAFYTEVELQGSEEEYRSGNLEQEVENIKTDKEYTKMKAEFGGWDTKNGMERLRGSFPLVIAVLYSLL